MVGEPVEWFKYHHNVVWLKNLRTTPEQFDDVGSLVAHRKSVSSGFIDIAWDNGHPLCIDSLGNFDGIAKVLQ